MNKSFKYFETPYIHPSYDTGHLPMNHETVKVLILLGSTYKTGNTSSSSGHLQKDGTITNYPVDIWKKIQQELETLNRYNFEIYLTDPNDINYTKTLQLINQGKFDVGIALYTITNERLKLADPTLPIVNDSLGIMFRRENFALKKLLSLSKKLFGIFAIMIVLGIIMGFVVHYVEPVRGKGVVEHIKIRSKYLRRSLLTSIAALFGELGFLHENSSLKIKGMVSVVFFFMFAYIFVAYIQTVIIGHVLETSDSNVFEQENVKNDKFVALPGYADVKKLERYGQITSLKTVKGDIENLADIIDDSTEYDGAIVGMIDSHATIKKYPKLAYSYSGFDKLNKYFYVSKNKPALLDDINYVITKLSNSLEMKRICRSYFEEQFVCESLS